MMSALQFDIFCTRVSYILSLSFFFLSFSHSSPFSSFLIHFYSLLSSLHFVFIYSYIHLLLHIIFTYAPLQKQSFTAADKINKGSIQTFFFFFFFPPNF